MSEIEQSIKHKIEAVGTPLGEWDIKISRGILTGCNDAFIISGVTKNRLIAEDPKSAEIIRPILRGRDIKRYSYKFADQWLIATFPSRHYDINQYPAIKRYLQSYGEARLAQSGEKNIDGIKGNNARKKTGNEWFETQDPIAYWDIFSKPKIAWGNLCLHAQFALVEEGYLVNAPSPIISPGYPWLLAVLNSSVADWYIRSLGVTRNGGYFEYKPMFVDKLPVPHLTTRQQERLSDLATRITMSNNSDDCTLAVLENEINDFVFDIYDLTNEERRFVNSAVK